MSIMRDDSGKFLPGFPSLHPEGCPVKELDRKIFEHDCEIGCTLEEIAGYHHVDEGTVMAWCEREYKTGLNFAS